MEMMRRRDDRIPSSSGLISYLQSVIEHEKAVLARELHDELGGLLVAASMDLAWLDKHIAAAPDIAAAGVDERRSEAAERTEVRRRLSRLKETVAVAVGVKRRVIEELRPTLLDNVGLLAALRWLVSDASTHTNLAMSFKHPAHEPQLGPEMSIALFRIAQAGLALITEYKSVQSVALRLDCHAHLLTLSIIGVGGQLPADPSPPRESFELAAIRHRSAVLGGSIRFSTSATGEIGLTASMPLESTGAC
jgi:signal transduction histidine kinase